MQRIVLAINDYPLSRILYHALSERYVIHSVIIEQSPSGWHIVRKRIKRLGLRVVLGQLLFKLLVVPCLQFVSKKRIHGIMTDHQMIDDEIPSEKVLMVDSINDDLVRSALLKIKPTLVVVNGTRIIQDAILNATEATFVNIHSGITPKYRGVHGGYWAAAHNDLDNCGVTVHLVDQGIDTGGILMQRSIVPTQSDNFITYPYLQLCAAIECLCSLLADLVDDKQVTIDRSDLDSKLWTHPTLFQYLYYRWFKGVA